MDSLTFNNMAGWKWCEPGSVKVQSYRPEKVSRNDRVKQGTAGYGRVRQSTTGYDRVRQGGDSECECE